MTALLNFLGMVLFVLLCFIFPRVILFIALGIVMGGGWWWWLFVPCIIIGFAGDLSERWERWS